jgi:hypothetical protein
MAVLAIAFSFIGAAGKKTAYNTLKAGGFVDFEQILC